jgi:hypothetical protein
VSDDPSTPEPLPEFPTAPPELPETLFTIRYDYGTPFSYGPIGQEVAWVFASEELAESAIVEALEAEPEAGELSVSEVLLEELADRFPMVLYVDWEGTLWPLVLANLGQDETELGDTPLPDEPYALFVQGGGIDRYMEEPREGDWVVHRDDDDEIDYVLFFEDLDTAEQILADFIEATGENAEVRRTRADTLTEDQGVRYYHASGHIEDLPRREYLRRCR